MRILKYQNLLFILPGVALLLSILALSLWGLKPGIDLVGGSLLEASYLEGRPDADAVRSAVNTLGLGEVRVQPSGDTNYILRQRDLTNDEHTALLTALGSLGALREEQFTSVGPTIGAELLRKAWIAIALVSILIVLFIAFAFRGVGGGEATQGRNRISSWKYGIVAILTLLHDIIIPLGLFALLGHLYGAEVDSLFIVALLTILGISINDTIVVFDRIRENLKLNEERHKNEPFEEVVDRSILQTLTRSVNTSLTVIITLVALYFLGPEATKNFALTLIVGMVAGTYSSIFLASPLLVLWEKFSRK